MIDSTRRSLMFHGCLLFFLGLTLVGLGAAFGLYASYRPAVAGHVEAVGATRSRPEFPPGAIRSAASSDAGGVCSGASAT